MFQMSIIKFACKDGTIFEAEIKIMMVSGLIKDMLENLGTENLENEIIPLSKIDGNMLAKIIEWATHHKNEPPFDEDSLPEEPEKLRIIDSWDEEFLNKVSFYSLEYYSLLLYLCVFNSNIQGRVGLISFH